MATPSDVLSWNIDSLRELSERAAAIADAIVGTSKTMRDTIYELAWTGDGRRAAEDRAEREREQIGAVASGYDALSAAAAGAHSAMSHPVSEIRSIIQNYVIPPVTLSDSWVVDGVEDWSSEAGRQLARLGGLVSVLIGADATWGAEVAEANQTLATMAPEQALISALAVITDSKRQSPRADPERLRASAAAFEEIFGREPSGPVDWKTAEALNPNSYDPKYQGVEPGIKVARIEPLPGQGVVRAALYIPAVEVFNAPHYDLGDNRAEAPNFDPEHARVVMYVDYENGLIVTRQNPSVDSTGQVRVGEPEVQAQQRPDGSIMISTTRSIRSRRPVPRSPATPSTARLSFNRPAETPALLGSSPAVRSPIIRRSRSTRTIRPDRAAPCWSTRPTPAVQWGRCSTCRVTTRSAGAAR
ncbi:hypothetical protein [Gordonia rubripertincta]|uniref:hypothetical protein n=1 Tax=Gordonia rubripertincta TaxID=36822 RepID=UPI0021B128E0|nr:hypothetical protein [Gordonia rubripertincta]